ncbi:neprilysin-2 [Condylostylus longicornis]|uniref:neprilysin-2 n=1 Tax=Condylostylus longicornis TaxID=2530218 RepID=UPI00244DD347|nr:neprilysin-2 [Condylostylus longicornis]XP_055373969.1 neprilysin-2 [Condylostylus longicornis]
MTNNGMHTIIKNRGWWTRRTTLEKTLTSFSILTIIALVISVIGLVAVNLSQKYPPGQDGSSTSEALRNPTAAVITTSEQHTSNLQKSESDKNKICLTKECIHTASKILDSMESSIEPCDDFYRFACGNFLKKTAIPEDKVTVNTFSEIGDELQQQLKELITEEAPEDSPKPFKMINWLYKSCMNKSLIEERGIKPIQQIAESIGGWPVVLGEKWNADSWTWQETTKKFRRLGYSVDYIIDFSVGIDLKNSTSRIIDLDQPSLGLSREYLIKGFGDPLVDAYYKYMIDIAVIFGADREKATEELKESIEFEMALANISLSNEKRRNTTNLYNPITLKQLQMEYTYMDWLDYINSLLPKSIQIDENEIINISVPDFLKNLGSLLAKTDKRRIANYLMWRIHGYSAFFLTEEIRKIQMKFITSVSGKQDQEPRWKECVDITASSLSMAVGSLYVRKHFKEDAKSIAMEMVNGIRQVFKKILQEVAWMDESTRTSALIKLEKMTTHIGYPNELMDDSKIENYYKELDIDPQRYLESILNMSIFGTNFAFGRLRSHVNKTDWITHAKPAVVNAYYASLENSIQFPAGILQGKFFSADRPKYMNYGAIGYVIGHEITHGFDDQGRQFDVNGNLIDWWRGDTKEAYLKRAKCIIEQYGNYTEPLTGLRLNGINTQGENIADNGGIKESYYAYKEWAAENKPEPSLPGLPYTPSQMFWISAAQTWCSKYRKESMKMRIITGVHSPAEFRVLGPMSNMEEFSNDFNCPQGSRMNPIHKCKVW